MELKLNNEIVQVENLKIIQTTKILQVAKNIAVHNKVLIITPFTKIKELFKITTLSFLFQEIINDDWINQFLNERELENHAQAINERAGFDLLETNLNFEKIVKIMFQINDDYVSKEVIWFLILMFEKHHTKQQIIVLCDLDELITPFLKRKINNPLIHIVFITSNIRDIQLSYYQLELLAIAEREVIDIIDYNKFKAWLEIKTKTVLKDQEIQNYFSNNLPSNEPNFLFYKIDLAIKNLII